MKLLHLDSSITGEGSASRMISAAIVERIRVIQPGLEVVRRDLAAEPPAHLTMESFLTLDHGEDVREFLEADVVVIGAGFYNFTIPSQLKAWIDRIAVRGRTFAYGESGPVGLSGGKPVIVALARGNVYGPGSPYEAFEHAEALLRSVFAFVGADVRFIIAEGIGLGEKARLDAIRGALEQAALIKRSSLSSAA